MENQMQSQTVPSPASIKVGDFIEIPAWQAFGCVQSISAAMFGSGDAREVLVQEHPDDERDKWNNYRLEPGEFYFLN